MGTIEKYGVGEMSPLADTIVDISTWSLARLVTRGEGHSGSHPRGGTDEYIGRAKQPTMLKPVPEFYQTPTLTIVELHRVNRVSKVASLPPLGSTTG